MEQEAANVGVKVKCYHTDNGVCAAREFRDHCAALGQVLFFSGVGAHHQNDIAEEAIQTVTNMARACMIHAQLH